MSVKRLLPGMTASELFKWPKSELSELEGSFAVQEYLQQMIRENCKDLEKIVELPADQDEHVWIFEHLRQFLLEINFLIVALSDACTGVTCPKMVVAKWEILCAAHKKPQEVS
jgi:hypothetical protein